MTLLVIATNSAKLESVCNQLQDVNMNIKAIYDHVNKLTDVLQSQSNNAFMEFAIIFEKAKKYEKLFVEFKRLRVVTKQVANNAVFN